MKRYFTSFLNGCIITIFLIAQGNTQTVWTKHSDNPVFSLGPSGSWDDAWVAYPFVIHDDTQFIMYYTGWPAVSPLGAKIGRATSDDGVNWTREITNPLITVGQNGQWDDGSVFTGPVIFDGSEYKMWYCGFDGSIYRSGLAISAYGSGWEKYAGNPVLDLGDSGQWDNMVIISSVIFEDSMYKAWYCGRESTTGIWRVGYATSEDGIIWEKYAGNPVLDIGEQGQWDDTDIQMVSVLHNNGIYEMWYGASDGSVKRTGYATSEDGIDWQKYSYNPILIPESSWETAGTEVSSVLFHDSRYKMWYSGETLSSGKIGFATSPVVVHVPDQVESIQAAIDSAADGNLILVDEGTYYENINFRGKKITVASQFYLDDDTSHISRTIINGSQHINPDSGSVVCFMSGEDTNSVLCGFTITGGSGTAVFDYGITVLYGGGINIYNSGGTIEHNIITNNMLKSTHDYQCGGGISSIGDVGDPIIIRNNKISSNSVEAQEAWGGGVLLGTKDTLFFENNTVIKNTAEGSTHAIGGGILVDGNYGYDGITILNSNRISYNELHSPQLLQTKGGGIDVNYSNCILTNNIIHENIAEDYGGGIHLNHIEDIGRQSQVNLINNTIVSNEADSGGGVSILGNYSDPVIINTILWDNVASGEGQQIYGTTINLNVNYSDIQSGWEGESNIDQEPLFTDTLFHLSDSSPCIGAGIDSILIGDNWYSCPNFSYFGDPRPNPEGSMPDIGASENPLAVAGIYELVLTTPSRFVLYQNYPNPFNPSTIIEFTIPKSEFTILRIYDILGKEVSTLISKKLRQGTYTCTFDGKNLASGIYFYQLVAGDYKEVKKMILLR